MKNFTKISEKVLTGDTKELNQHNEVVLIDEREVCEKTFRIYGTVEKPLFLAKDVAEWIEHSKISVMLGTVSESEKVRETIFTSGQNREAWFLTEDGLYDICITCKRK